jgi:ssRNA-specific RNase YbeY (16S rRNA maturation enzyme)
MDAPIAGSLAFLAMYKADERTVSAARAGARLEDHWRAALVHGLVHLLGHDHEPDGVGVDLVADAAALMGRREREVAARLAELEREAVEPLRLFA